MFLTKYKKERNDKMQNKRLEELKQYKKMLYVVDMVKGFVTEGPMHDPYIAHTLDEQLKLIEKFQKEQEGLAFIKDNHQKDAIEFQSFPPHCVIGTREAELVDELQQYENQGFIYPKNSTSAFTAPNVVSDINKIENLEEVVGVGCCTDICVPNFLIPLKNYFNQLNKDVAVFVVQDATETYDAPNHNRTYYNKVAYEFMKQAGIIVVKDIEELEKEEQKILIKKEGKKHENL